MAKKKEKKASKPMQVWTLYDKGTRKNKTCPKCGPGVFLAAHKDREVCGKCGFTQFAGKENKPAEDKKEEKKADTASKSEDKKEEKAPKKE